VMVCHLVLAEIQANHEKRAFFVGVGLIDEHGGCAIFNDGRNVQFYLSASVIYPPLRRPI
jgi:hypothetical protein